jgi:hypothetical protein
MAFFLKTKLNYTKNHKIGFWEKRHFLLKLSKITDYCDRNIDPRVQCYDFWNIFAEKIGGKMALFTPTTASFCKNLIITLFFEKNANILCPFCYYR